MLARSLGRISYFTEPEARALLQLKQKYGYQDPRTEIENCDICANDAFRDSWTASGVKPQAFEAPRFRKEKADAPSGSNGGDTSSGETAAAQQQEALIQAITDRVMTALSKS